MNKRKPKFKVGDRIFWKHEPEWSSVIIGVSHDYYKLSVYYDGEYIKEENRWDYDTIDKLYTLDLNHYIKNL